MAELLDTVSKELSSSIEIKKGIAALLVSSADSEQRALDAYAAMKAERDNFETKYKEEREARLRADKEVERLRKIIASIPRVQIKDCDIKELTTGNKFLMYGQDDSNTRQLNSRVGAG